MRLHPFKEKTFLLLSLGCLYFMSMEELFVSMIGILILETILHNRRFRVSLFPGFGIYIWFLLSGMAVGIYCVLFHSYAPRDVLKDMIYVLFPLVFWLLGKNITLRKETVWTCLFVSGVLVSFCDFVNGLFKVFQNDVSGLSLYQFRHIVGIGHPLTLVTLFIYMFMPQTVFFKKKKQVYVCIGILLVNLLFHFSRITLLNSGIFLLYLGVWKKPKNAFKYVFFVVIGLAGTYIVFPSVFESYMGRLLNSLTEISYIQDSWDHMSIVTNWRGYEVYCELEKFRNTTILEQIFGGGFGTQLNVKGKAYLVTTEATLPFLHNGYFSILMIWGVFGCMAYIFMISILYQSGGLTGEMRRFWKALVIVVVADTFFIHGLFFGTSVASIFLYLGVLDNMTEGVGEDGRRSEKIA